MNAKLCKRLRHMAQERTEGLPLRKLIPATALKYRRTDPNTVRFAINDPGTTRGAYRLLKKVLRVHRRRRHT